MSYNASFVARSTTSSQRSFEIGYGKRIHQNDYDEEFDAPESLRPRRACAAALFRAIRARCSSVSDGGADTTAADVARGDSSSGG